MTKTLRALIIIVVIASEAWQSVIPGGKKRTDYYVATLLVMTVYSQCKILSDPGYGLVKLTFGTSLSAGASTWKNSAALNPAILATMFEGKTWVRLL